jgi:hypothetical protein
VTAIYTIFAPRLWITCPALPKVTPAPSAEKNCHAADSVQNGRSTELPWRNRMSNDEKFKKFRAYQFESEQSERKASKRKWVLILILACSSIATAWLLSR